mmetsp:Transcript_11904/g.27765  ORF Transcript_11904/g.27765 Transcript_11904/m.27765 type:complete len:218 (-) Transcript_11904:1033-1686(-)
MHCKELLHHCIEAMDDMDTCCTNEQWNESCQFRPCSLVETRAEDARCGAHELQTQHTQENDAHNDDGCYSSKGAHEVLEQEHRRRHRDNLPDGTDQRKEERPKLLYAKHDIILSQRTRGSKDAEMHQRLWVIQQESQARYQRPACTECSSDGDRCHNGHHQHMLHYCHLWMRRKQHLLEVRSQRVKDQHRKQQSHANARCFMQPLMSVGLQTENNHS